MTQLLKDRVILKIAGEDRKSFLQGLITNDINLLDEGNNAIYSCLLNNKGQYLFDFFIIEDGDNLLLDIDRDRVERFAKILKIYKLRSKVSLEILDSKIYWMLDNNFTDAIVYQDTRSDKMGYRLITDVDIDTDDAKLSYETYRIKNQIPKSGQDLIIEKSTLLECNIDKLNGISWSKGCYIGQEVTARMHYKGTLKKRLYSIEIKEEFELENENYIYMNDKKIGNISSFNSGFGLALLNIAKLDNASELEVIINKKEYKIIINPDCWN